MNTVDNKVISNETMNIDSKYVDLLADKIVTTLNNPGSRTYYCKLFYSLPESKIWDNLGQAQKGKNPARLFTWLCQRDLGS